MKLYTGGLLLVLCSKIAVAQIAGDRDSTGKMTANLEAMSIGTSGKQVPFWMRTNQFGSIPEPGISGSMAGNIYREYAAGKKTDLMDWGAGIEGRANLGNKVNFLLIEAYAKARLSIFQLKAGRSRDIMGLADPDLSSGNFSISGNALGIPKVELSIPEYWTVPLTRDFLAIKGSFAYGWFGTVKASARITTHTDAQALYHQKSFYARLGKPEWKVKLYGGFNHQVMWADENRIYGSGYKLSQLQELWYVTVGKAYGNDSIPRSKVGNHMGSLDQAIAFEFPAMTLELYHQFYYEVGGLYHLNNIKDGLWGISCTNKAVTEQRFGWRKLLVEFLYSKSQGGEAGAKVTPSGDEDYYNNYLYVMGWTYQEENLGNNFMTNKKYQRTSLPQQPHEYIGNNRIMLLHFGALLNCYSWNITTKLSYSMNYGTYATSPDGVSTGGERQVFPPPYFSKVNQFSGYLEASKPLKKGYSIGFVLAGDYGDLLYKSIGGMIRFSKKW